MTGDPRAQAQIARLGQPGLSRLWAAARRRLERDPQGWTGGRILIPAPDEAERAELEALLGRPCRGGTLSIGLAEVDAALRAGPLAIDLPGWLGRSTPLRDRPGETAALQARLEAAARTLHTCRHADAPWFHAWSAAQRRQGGLTRLDTEGQLGCLASVVAVLDRLPCGGLPRMVLAADATGDPKALESGPIARVVLSALAAWTDVELSDRDSERALWEQFDLWSDDLASQVIALGLRPTGDDALSSWLRAAADAGHPVVLTRRDLSRPLSFGPGLVSACENPSVVHTAARRLGPRCPPLLCTVGRPHAAFWALADALRAGGAELRYHGDFDAAGLDIAAAVMRRTGAQPWRMSAPDYLQAAPSGQAWRGRLQLRSPWDPELAERMAERGCAVFEEQVMEVLIADLAG